MEYRGVEYSVAQGIECGMWKWSTSLDKSMHTQKTDKTLLGPSRQRIDDALAPKKRRLVKSH
jgi:hypothetical protein